MEVRPLPTISTASTSADAAISWATTWRPLGWSSARLSPRCAQISTRQLAFLWPLAHASCKAVRPRKAGFSHLWRSHFHPLSGSFGFIWYWPNWPIPSSIANCCDYRKDLVGLLSLHMVDPMRHDGMAQAWCDWDRYLHDQLHFGNQHEGTAAQGLRALSGRLPAD